MMRLGKPSLEKTSHALFPRAPLTATLLICCRLRGVSTEEKTTEMTFWSYMSYIVRVTGCTV